MEKKFKLGVIGAGFMATAIIQGALKAKIIAPEQVIVSDVFDQALEKISLLGVNTSKNNSDVFENCEFILFAVKPQNLKDVFNNVTKINCKKYISIMAGVKKKTVKNLLKIKDAQIARCMPNTPCSIGSGAIGIDFSDYKCNRSIKFIKSLFSSLAVVETVTEDKLNVVTGISGSSPAYFYLFLQGIIDAGVKRGLDYETSKNLATATMIGAGKMVQNNPDKTIDQLITAVCSKGGTTIEAVKVYNDNDLQSITDNAVGACVKRSEELENL